MEIRDKLKGITQSRLKELLKYDPDTGVFTWLVNKSSKAQAGDVAGATVGNGYVGIGIDRRLYLAHRLAFLYMHGEFPAVFVDHKNGNPSDNRWDNLRAASKVQNQRNSKLRKDNTSGFKGVVFDKRKRKFQARIKFNRRLVFLGLFENPAEAALAYDKAASELHGEFARLNMPGTGKTQDKEITDYE